MKKEIKIIIITIIMTILSCYRVEALTFDDLSYGSKVYFLDFTGGTDGKYYNIINPNFGTEYWIYYQQMTSATYGIGAGVYLDKSLSVTNTYRVTYVWNRPSGGCSIYNWNQFGVLQNLSDRGQQNLKSRQTPSIDEGVLNYNDANMLNVCVYSATFVPDKSGSALVLPMKSGVSTNETFVFYGYILEDTGSGEVLVSTINDNFRNLETQNNTIINQNGTIINQNQTQINNQNEIKQKQDETNQKLEDIKNADAPASITPNTSKYNDFDNKKETLVNEMKKADMSKVEIAIDDNSSNFVWTLMTNLLNTNNLIIGLYISILSLGIIKLILGR